MTAARRVFGDPYAEAKAALREQATDMVYSGGTTVFQQGEGSGAVYLIDSGLVKTASLSPEGEEVITGLRSSGCLLGAEAAILNLPYVSSAITLTRCSLGSIARQRFLHLLRANSRVSWYLHELHSREVLEQAQQQAIRRTATLRARFAQFLHRFLPSSGPVDPAHPLCVEIPLKQLEVAQLLSVTPEHFSRLASLLEHDGVIQRQGRFVTVLRPGDLFE